MKNYSLDLRVRKSLIGNESFNESLIDCLEQALGSKLHLVEIKDIKVRLKRFYLDLELYLQSVSLDRDNAQNIYSFSSDYNFYDCYKKLERALSKFKSNEIIYNLIDHDEGQAKIRENTLSNEPR